MLAAKIGTDNDGGVTVVLELSTGGGRLAAAAVLATCCRYCGGSGSVILRASAAIKTAKWQSPKENTEKCLKKNAHNETPEFE